jgi:energy-coupling factor transport system ATP-binding protein
MVNNNIIEVDCLRFRYANSEKFALNGVSFKVRRGEFFTIMGQNGAGKTTLALCLAGVIPHYIEGEFEGKVFVDGIDVASHTIPEATTKLGLILQDPEDQIIGVTVRDDVAFGPCNLGLSKEVVLERVKNALKMVRLDGYEDRETFALSGGEKQRLAIAGILALGSNIIVADEPTSQLDPVGKKEVFETLLQLNKEGKTIIMITHETDWAMKYSHRIGILSSGRLIAIGSPKEILSKLGIDGLTRYGIRPPQIPHLFYKLSQKGVILEDPSTWLNVEEATYRLSKLITKSLPKDVLPLNKCDKHYEERAIVVEDLWHIYPNGIKALKGISLQIYKGEFVAIVGQNGSGKTTLVKHFNGLLKPTKGNVYVFGINTKDVTVSALSKFVGYVFQNPDNQLFASSVKEEIAFGPKNLGYNQDEVEKMVEQALDFVGLKGLENEHPFHLSKAERQLVAFASVIAMKPKVIVVDEPTTGQDWAGTYKIMNMLKKLNEEGHTVIVVTHDMNIVAEYAERVIVLHSGRILTEGETRKIFYEIENLSQAYIEPPPIVLLVNYLKEYGVPPGILTVEEAATELYKKTKGES